MKVFTILALLAAFLVPLILAEEEAPAATADAAAPAEPALEPTEAPCNSTSCTECHEPGKACNGTGCPISPPEVEVDPRPIGEAVQSFLNLTTPKPAE